MNRDTRSRSISVACGRPATGRSTARPRRNSAVRAFDAAH